MSAYICSRKTFSNIISWYRAELTENSYVIGPLKELGYRTEEDIKKLWNDLGQANKKAVSHRYPDSGKVTYPRFTSLRALKSASSYVQVLKSMHCLLYQMSEGDVSNSNIFKALDTVSEKLASEIITASPEYCKAEWG